jgi:hypothetical protein
MEVDMFALIVAVAVVVLGGFALGLVTSGKPQTIEFGDPLTREELLERSAAEAAEQYARTGRY